MLTLYTNTATPNGMKVILLLEELGAEYKTVAIDFSKDEQFSEAFLTISPNNKIPALEDEQADGSRVTLFESGAIMLYLAEKTGRFLNLDLKKRAETLVWLFWQNASLGPMLGQAHHFAVFAPERVEYALERYTKEAQRLYRVLERRLQESAWLGGDEISIADFAAYPWTHASRHAAQGIALKNFPRVEAWLARIEARERIQAAYKKYPPKAPLEAKHRHG